MNRERLFFASCISLIATAMSFAIRGDIMGDFEEIFHLSNTNVGWIVSGAFWGFGLSILIGGPLCDSLGMRNLLRLAALGHIAGTVLTILAGSFAALFFATLIIGIANGLVEAAINPLVATLYSEQKTRKLVVLHAWFPGGIVIGGVLSFLFTQIGLGWQAKMTLLLIPSIIYAILFIGQTFPATERVAAGVSASQMFKEATRPLFILLFFCMWLTAATELDTNQWIPNIFDEVMHGWKGTGILVLVWINGLMYLLRQFAGGFAHKISPVALIASTSVLAVIGMVLFSFAETPLLAFVATGIFATGIAFWWPTMLGITSERFPKGGAFLLALIGATGSFSTAIGDPLMGWVNDRFGADKVLLYWAVLPALLFVLFMAIYLRDRARGGYRVEQLDSGA